MNSELEINRSFQPEFKAPEFAPPQISDLRGRLGQSRADFARAFAVSLELVYAWENGTEKPTSGQRCYMARLRQHAEEYSDKVALRPALECALRERGVDQIHSSDLTLDESFNPTLDVTKQK